MKSQKTEISLKIIKFGVFHPVLMFSIKHKCTTLQNNLLNFRCVFFEKFYKEIFCNQIFPFLVTAILVTIATFFKCYKISNKLQNSLKFGVYPKSLFWHSICIPKENITHKSILNNLQTFQILVMIVTRDQNVTLSWWFWENDPFSLMVFH